MAFAYSYFFIAPIDEIDTTSLCCIPAGYLIGVRRFARRNNLNAGLEERHQKTESHQN
jgi:hypothetical protein